MSAKQDSVSNVRFSAVPSPMVDVMSFRPGDGPIAARPPASAVACGQPDALPGGVEALFPAKVDALAFFVEGNRDAPGFADDPFDGFEGDGRGLAFDAAVTAAGR